MERSLGLRIARALAADDLGGALELQPGEPGVRALVTWEPVPVRVLIAEDETIIRLDLRGLLERAGHEVVGEARDGDEAVALAERARPELVIMDVKMPRLDGIEAARRIVASRPVPIVMLTAYTHGDLVGGPPPWAPSATS